MAYIKYIYIFFYRIVDPMCTLYIRPGHRCTAWLKLFDYFCEFKLIYDLSLYR